MPLPPKNLEEAVINYRDVTDAALQKYAQQFLSTVTFPVVVDPTPSYLEANTGGKRFRALCCAIGAVCALPPKPGRSAAGALEEISTNDSVVALGCALEFYQASALVHDDLLDNSATRRGRPAAHTQFTALHSQNSLLGDATDFGRDGAVLVGNLLTSAGEFTLASALDAKTPGARLLRAYAVMTGEVAVGQLADTSAAYLPVDASPRVAETLDIVRHKSARYSIMNPARLGAIALDGNELIVHELETILEPAGVAFQLRDDALGVFGEDEQMGKPTGNDIAEGKRTVLLALTLQQAPRGAADRLISMYAQGSRDSEDVAFCIETMRKFGRDAHEQLISSYQEKAFAALAESSFTGAARELLEDLVTRVVSRNA